MCKPCAKCGATDRNKTGRCKPCLLAKAARYRAANPMTEEDRARQAGYTKAWRAAKGEALRKEKAVYYQANKVRIMQKVRDDRARDLAAARAKHREYSAAHRAKHIEKVRASARAWTVRNSDALMRNAATRRARKLQVGGVLSKDIRSKLFALQRGMCPCCGQPLGDAYHLDHVMPLTLRGINEDSNAQLLCKTCNLSKGAKHPIDFMQEKGFLL